MSFFTPDYNSPGPGVPKGEAQKIGLIRYFIVSGRKFWDMVTLNIIYSACSIPMFVLYTLLGWFFLGGLGEALGAQFASEGMTQQEILEINAGMHLIISASFGLIMTGLLGSGGARAGLSYVLRNYSREEHAFLWSDFREYFKKYFWKGTLISVIDVIFTFIICLDVSVYGGMQSYVGLVASYFAIFIFIIYILMHPYMYMLLVTFDMGIKKMYKNAFMLSVIKIFQNLGCLIAALFLMILMLELVYMWVALLFILFILFFSFTNLILDMNSFSVVKKYMIK